MIAGIILTLSLEYIDFLINFAEALRRVWRNMHDEERRREKGKKRTHRRKSKQAKRIRNVRFTLTDFI